MEKPEAKKNSNKKPKKKPYNDFVKYSGLGFQMAGVMVAGYFVSVWVSGKVSEDSASIVQALVILFFVIAAIYLGLKDFIIPPKK